MSELIRVLEDALAANPDDLATHMAYADLLSDQGNPRGELIQAQLALEQLPRHSPQRDVLRRRYAALAVEHGRSLLGELAPYLLERPCTYAEPFRFRLGWLDILYVDRLDVGLARALARAPEARLLSTLRIDDIASESTVGYQAGADTPTAQDFPALLVLCRTRNLANLRWLELRGYALSPPELDVLLNPPHLPRLIHLGLRLASALETEDCETLLASSLLRQLKVLDLQRCGLTDVQARVLATGDLTHLELLNVDNNRLTAEGLRVLRATGATVQGSPSPLDPDDFNYLDEDVHDGDME